MRTKKALYVGMIVAVLGAALFTACAGSEDVAEGIDTDLAALSGGAWCGGSGYGGSGGVQCAANQVCCGSTCTAACRVCSGGGYGGGTYTCTNSFDLVYPKQPNAEQACATACATLGKTGTVAVIAPMPGPYGGTPGRTLCSCR